MSNAIPDPLYVGSPTPQHYLVDKTTGAPLSAGTISYFRDVSRTTPKHVYMLSQTQISPPVYAFVDVGAVVTLSSVGTPQYNGVDFIPYLWPYSTAAGTQTPGALDLYYLEIASSGGTLQETRNAWPPNAAAIGNASTVLANGDNMISNSQFSEVLFTNDIGQAYATFSVSGTNTVTAIAPGWDIVTTGTGTVQVSQIAITDSSITTNPPYALGLLSSAGVTKLWLQQTFSHSPRLFVNSFLNGSFIGLATVGSPTITMTYGESNGSTWNLATGAVGISFSALTATTQIISPPTISTDSSTTGYSVLYLNIPLQVQVEVSSVQLIAVETVDETAEFIQESIARQQDHLSHYWQPWLNYKPLKSLLVGWDFPLNPAQARGTSVTATATASYVWDQLIIGSAVGNISVGRNAVSGGLQATNASANDAFYMLQYLSGAQAQAIINGTFSVNINGYVTTGQTNVIATVYLFTGRSGAAFPTLGTTIGTIASSGVFTLTAASWTAMPNSINTAWSQTVPQSAAVISSVNDLKYPGYALTDSTQIANTNKFAIVVTFKVPTISTTIVINSISLVPGFIPTRPAPQTATEVLRDCQYYYQKSFPLGTIPAYAIGANSGETIGVQTVGSSLPGVGPIITFQDPLITTPAVVLYNPTYANGEIENETTATSWSSTTVLNGSSNGFYTHGTSDGTSAVGQVLGIHWTADARIGM